MCKPYKLTIILVLGLLTPFLNTYAKDTLRDPTQPPSFKDTIPTYTLNKEISIDAIYARKDHSSVIIDNHIFTIGDKILDSTIAAIDTHSIKLKNEDGEFKVITMPCFNVKSPIIKNKKNTENEKLE